MGSRKEYEMLFQLNAQLGGSYNATFVKAQKEIATMQEKIKTLSKTQSDMVKKDEYSKAEILARV